MKFWSITLLRLLAAGFLFVTGLYCLLAFLPYTFYAFVKAPPQAWIPLFAKYHPLESWLTFAAIFAANWRYRSSRTFLPSVGSVAVLAAVETFHPFIRSIGNDASALIWGCVVIFIAALAPLPALESCWPRDGKPAPTPFPLHGAAAWGMTTAMLGLAGTALRFRSGAHSVSSSVQATELTAWSMATHLTLALAAACGVNLFLIVVSRTGKPRFWAATFSFVAIWAGFFWTLKSALANILSFQGPAALCYAFLFSLALVLTGFSAVLQVSGPAAMPGVSPWKSRKIPAIAAGIALMTVALLLPSWIGDFDWNGLFLHTFTVVFWSALALLIWWLGRQRRVPSAARLAGVLVVSLFAYSALRATEIFWSRDLGNTDDEIRLKLQKYATQDPSFQLAYYALGNAPAAEPCGELCRLLRENTNIRQAKTQASVDFQLPLTRPGTPLPNVFILVIDSLRPDYLGAYNTQVDFTPNIDALARDSAVFRKAYTQYAGTTLSEPVIWSGAMLLHAHYPQPFSQLNSLEKLVRADGYQMYVTDDTVLKQLLSPDDKLHALDTQTLWNHVDLCQTGAEFFRSIDQNHEAGPVFFYSQPLNVHQFANNGHATARQNGWRRPGFNDRISNSVHQVDACLGEFVANLKSRHLYDDSIIVLTSDHGEATGELGRSLHAEIVYPEVMHVPLIVHLPRSVRTSWSWDPDELAALTDIAPSLYALAGHDNLRSHAMFGHSLFAHSQKELQAHARHELFLASDTRAAYGILDQDGRLFYATYDRPAQSYLYDLAADPEGTRNVLTPELKRAYDRRILQYLKEIAEFYGYQPSLRSLIATR